MIFRPSLEDIVTSKEVLASFISENLPGYEVSPVPGDGLCMVHSFSSALTTLHGRTFTNNDVICKLRGELLSNFDFYKVFCPGVSILSELEKFLQNPLACYNAEVFDLFMHASGNAFEVNIIIFCADTKKAWIVDLSKNDKNTTQPYILQEDSLCMLILYFQSIVIRRFPNTKKKS